MNNRCPYCTRVLNTHTTQTWSMWPGWICLCGAVFTAENMDGTPKIKDATAAEVNNKILRSVTITRATPTPDQGKD